MERACSPWFLLTDAVSRGFALGWYEDALSALQVMI
jgi:hypothetical protein